MEVDIYEKNGYKNRREYLKSLAEEYGIPFSVVLNMAIILGESEDFDGLPMELEEYVEC